MVDGEVRRRRLRRNEQMSIAWHTAAFTRAKSLPSHDSLMEQEPKKPQNVTQMINACRAIAFMHGGKEQIVG